MVISNGNDTNVGFAFKIYNNRSSGAYYSNKVYITITRNGALVNQTIHQLLSDYSTTTIYGHDDAIDNSAPEIYKIYLTYDVYYSNYITFNISRRNSSGFVRIHRNSFQESHTTLI